MRPIVRNFTGDRKSITLYRTNMAIFDDLLDPTPSVGARCDSTVPMRIKGQGNLISLWII